MFLALCLVLAPQLQPAERLSGSLEGFVAPGDVEAFDVSPDGNWVVYRAPQDSAVPGLYLTRADGSTPSVRLSAPGASVGAFAFSPTGASIVYLAGGELFRVGASGQVVRLHPALQPGASVQAFALSSDGARALYRADVEVAGRLDLYSVNLVGVPQGVRLSRVGPAQGDVGEFWIAPGGQRVVFVGDLVVDTRQELFSAPLDGSQPDVALCGSFVAGGGLNGFTGAPRTDGTRVLYLADQLVDGKFELFSVPIDASAAPLHLNGVLPALGDVTSFQLAPAGGRVAFTADALVDERAELFSVPTDGSAPAVQVNGAVTPVSSYVLAPSGQRIAFVDRPCSGPSNQLWSVPADGSAAPLMISDHPTAWRCVAAVTITPDSLAALYVVSYGSLKTLLRAPLDGSTAPLEIQPPVGAQVSSCRLTPDGLTLVLECEVVPTSTRVLAVAPADGSAPAMALHASAPQLLGPRDDLELVGGQVVFRADLERPDVLELYSVPLDASQLPARLSDEPYVVPLVTDVRAFALSADGTRLGYMTGLGVHALELDTGLTRTLTRTFTQSGQFFQGMALTPDGSRCFWLGSGLGTHLFSAPFDGSGPVVQVSAGEFAPGFGATIARFSPDGTRYTFGYSTYFGPGSIYIGPTDLSTLPVFLESSSVHGLNYLGAEIVYAWTQSNPYYPEPTYFYRRAADASTPPAHLLAPPPGWAAQGHLTATPDGTRVLLVRDQEEEFKRELYSLSLAPGALPIKLNDALGPGRAVLTGVVPTPDSTRVLYLANRDASNVYELYVVPVDGSAPPLELSGTIVAGGSVSFTSGQVIHVWVTPDSTRALYVADALVDNRKDLYSVPLDGSAPPTLLAASPLANGDVDTAPGSVQLSPDGSRVYFRGNFHSLSRYMLFSVSLAGGPVVTVGTIPQPFATLSLPYFPLADGRVVYRMNLELDQRDELWIARGDRPGRSHRRSFLGQAGGVVEPDFTVDAAGEWIYYRADARVDEEIELYRYPVDPPPYARRR
ncbi:MAG TPA: hypothetical protein VF530_09440 [Planctomycetota bacterium]